MLLMMNFLRSFDIFSKFQLICNGHFYEDWIDEDKPINTATYIPLSCFIIHFILSLAIAKSGKIHEETGKNAVNFGELKTSWMFLALSSIFVFSLIKMKSLHPKQLNEYPNNLIIYNNYFALPAIVSLAFVILFYGKNSKLRKAAKNAFCPENTVNA